MKLVSTRQSYAIDTEYGRVQVDVVLDEEWGWHASMTISSFGVDSADAAVASLVPVLERILADLRKRDGD